MDAKELIGLLQQIPSNTKIVVRGYEDGYNDISQLKAVRIIHNPDEVWYYGEYTDSKTPGSFDAIELFGENKNKES